MAALGKIKVLVVDDSALVRQVLTQGLSLDPGIEVVGAAMNPYQARDMIVKHKPDVVTLDVEMPRMDGVTFLRRLMPQFPLPVIMVSSLTQRGKQITLDAMEAGAVDIVAKPSTDLSKGLQAMMQELRTKVKIASTANVSHWKNKRIIKKPANMALQETTDKVIAIGASTGGTEAIRLILERLPANSPGIVVVQHMPPGFTRMFAERLNQKCALMVKEAENGDRVIPGRVLIAPGDKHMQVRRQGGIYEVTCKEGPPVCGHCPSVESLFQSVAYAVGSNAVGVILTGMGRDGAAGITAMRRAGARTLGQDEDSCVVYGMPKEAFELGGIERQYPLEKMAEAILFSIKKITAKA